MRRETAGGVCARVHACARTAASHGATAWGLPRLLRCRYGGSYGGYATLAGLTFTPELYSCGVDIVGPSNLQACRAAPRRRAAPRLSRCVLHCALYVARCRGLGVADFDLVDTPSKRSAWSLW